MSRRRRISKRDQAMLDEGYAAAALGKTVDDCPYQGPWARNAWIIGWRNGGGNIMTGKSRFATLTTAETPGGPRCERCDNGLESEWLYCPFCAAPTAETPDE